MKHFLCASKEPSTTRNCYVGKNNPMAIIVASSNTHNSVLLLWWWWQCRRKVRAKKEAKKEARKVGRREERKRNNDCINLFICQFILEANKGNKGIYLVTRMYSNENNFFVHEYFERSWLSL